MFKNIQKYLLLSYPLIWNLKVFPFLICTVLANILLFIIGYLVQRVSILDYSSIDTSYPFVYFILSISSILLFILWIVNYAKNNAIKNYYPTNASKLYCEWVLSFLTILSITFLPYSFSKGSSCRIASYASSEEVKDAIETLNMVKILMPSEDSKMSYFQEKPTELSSPRRESMSKMNEDTEAEVATYTEDYLINYPDYPDFRQFSFLNYSPNYYDDDRNSAEIVKDWLQDGKTEKIKELMTKYLELEKKNGVIPYITVDEWFSKIYNPPTFEINENNLFKVPYYYDKYTLGKSFAYQYLKNGYNNIRVEQDMSIFNSVLLYYLLYMSLALSMLVFSFRVTSGRTWLIAMIAIILITVILSFVTSFFSLVLLSSADLNPFISYGLLIILLFIGELYVVLTTKSKDKTGVLLNHVIGLLPIVPIITVSIFLNIMDHEFTFLYESFLYINVAITFVTMFILIKYVIIKWKGLPEE